MTGFDLPAGSKILAPGIQLLTTPKVNKNFIEKSVEGFSNTVSMWVQNAGELKRNTYNSYFYFSS